jgi:hypothetical protein
MNYFYVITISWVSSAHMTLENVQKIEAALTHFGQWFRFSGSTWIIWTDVSEQVLYGAIKLQITVEDSFLITKFDADQYTGWGPTELQEWLNERKPKLIS